MRPPRSPRRPAPPSFARRPTPARRPGAQSFALAAVDTEFVLAVDADTTLAPDAIELLAAAFADPQVAAASGKRHPPPRAQHLGAGPLRRVPARLRLLQASPGPARQATDRVGVLLDVPNRAAARRGRLVDAHDGRGHGPHLDHVRTRSRDSLRRRRGLISDRAPVVRLPARAAAPLVARLRPERPPAPAVAARARTPALVRDSGRLGRPARIDRLPVHLSRAGA